MDWKTKITIIAISVLYFLLMPKVGYTANSDILTHFGYVFSHGNIFHLMSNMIFLCILRNKMPLVPCYLIAVLASFIPSPVNGITMGFSGFLFAYVSMEWGAVRRVKDAIKCVLPFCIVTMWLPNVNGFIHLYCAVLGFLYGYFYLNRLWKKNMAS